MVKERPAPHADLGEILDEIDALLAELRATLEKEPDNDEH